MDADESQIDIRACLLQTKDTARPIAGGGGAMGAKAPPPMVPKCPKWSTILVQRVQNFEHIL